MQNNETGLISPAKFYNVNDKPKYKSAGFHDLARAAKSKLHEKLGNSGTAARTMDIAKIAAVLSNPALAAKIAAVPLAGRMLNEGKVGALRPTIGGAATGEAAMQSVNDRADEFLRSLAGFR